MGGMIKGIEKHIMRNRIRAGLFGLALLLATMTAGTPAQAGSQADMAGTWSIYEVTTDGDGREMAVHHGSMVVAGDGEVTSFVLASMEVLDPSAGPSSLVVTDSGLLDGQIHIDTGDKLTLQLDAVDETGSVATGGAFLAFNPEITGSSFMESDYWCIKRHDANLAGELAGTWHVNGVGTDQVVWGHFVLDDFENVTDGELTASYDGPATVTAGTLGLAAGGRITGGSMTIGGSMGTIEDGQVSEDGYLMLLAWRLNPDAIFIFLCIREGAPSGTTFDNNLEGTWYLTDAGMEDEGSTGTVNDPGDQAWADGILLTVDENGNFSVPAEPGVTGTMSADSTGDMTISTTDFRQGRLHYGNQVFAFVDAGSLEAGFKAGVRYSAASNGGGGGGGGGGCMAGPASGAGLEWLLLAGAALFGLRRSRRQ